MWHEFMTFCETHSAIKIPINGLYAVSFSSSLLFIYCACPCNKKKAAEHCTVDFVFASNWTFWQLCGVRLRNSNLLKTADILLFKYHGMWISSLQTRLRSAAVYLLFRRIIVYICLILLVLNRFEVSLYFACALDTPARYFDPFRKLLHRMQ